MPGGQVARRGSAEGLAMKLRGSLPVVPTPFYRGQIDYDSLLKLFEFLFPELDGYTLCGSTGESASLSLEERLELARFAARHTPAGKTVVVGLTHTNLGEMGVLARSAQELGLSAGLVPCPYYFPNSFPMVLELLRALDRLSDLELVMYDNPLYTKTSLSAAEILRLVEACRHLKAAKITDHDLTKIPTLKQSDVTVFSGDDVVAFRSLLLGADGSMIIAPAVFPAAFQTVVRSLSQGDAVQALRVFAARVLPFIHLFGPGDEIATTKALYRHLGIFRSAEVRPPLLPCSAERFREVLLAYEACQQTSSVGEHG
jgi:4-hydroxy-tetrahydrodipicolinate synthase